MSPMKWIMLSFITQSSIIQAVSFMSVKKANSLQCPYSKMSVNKMNWKW